MNIKLIRNATMIITYNNKRFLLDPFLAEKGSHPAIEGTINANADVRNPLVGLPLSIDEIIKDIDAVIVTHIHPDHFDDVAKEVLPKDIKMFVQNEKDAEEIKNAGFKNIEILSENGTMFSHIKLTKTIAIHGEDETVFEKYKELNVNLHACGVIFSHEDEKTLYLTGDTVWCDDIKNILTSYKPEIIVANVADGQLDNGKSMIMGKEDVTKINNICPNSNIIAIHLEAVNPTVVTRKELREFANEKHLSNLLIPEDGQDYTL